MDYIKILIILMNITYIMKVYFHFRLIKLIHKNETHNNLRSSVYNIGCLMYQSFLPLFIILDEEERKLEKLNKSNIILMSKITKLLVYSFWVLFVIIISIAVYYYHQSSV